MIWILLHVATAVFANGCDFPVNKIVAENCKQGNPSSEWDINMAGDRDIQGFAFPFSSNAGSTVVFKIKSISDNYRIDIYRAGYYQGNGARLITSFRPSVRLPQHQPECLFESETRLVDCGNWQESATWDIPTDALSGVYFARLVREDSNPGTWRVDYSPVNVDKRFNAEDDTNTERLRKKPHAYGNLGYGKPRDALKEPRASHIIFVVRNDDRKADIVVQTSDTTWQAYNHYGGQNTYLDMEHMTAANRARKVSYNRPFWTRDIRSVNYFFGPEFPFVRFLERNGYDVTYISGIDTARDRSLLLNAKVFCSVGHDEYWSGLARRNVEKSATEDGLHLMFLSGNEVYWKIRFESDANGEPWRTLVVYKETQDSEKSDPSELWTGTWRDSSPHNPEGGQPENALTGTIYTVNAWRHDPMFVPARFSKLRFWRETSVSNLQEGETKMFPAGILGHEWDEDLDNGFRPAGQIRMSQTEIDNVLYIQDYGSVYDTGSATHHLTMHRHGKGIVFGAGTVQWTWGLDEMHDNPTGVPPRVANPHHNRVGKAPHMVDRDLQQATVNVLIDMEVRPGNLQSGLVLTEPISDYIPPRTNVTRNPEILTTCGECIEIRGVITDEEGVPAGVEISFDGPGGWFHPANLDGNVWWFQVDATQELSRLNFYIRGVDDSLNLEIAHDETLEFGEWFHCSQIGRRPLTEI